MVCYDCLATRNVTRLLDERDVSETPSGNETGYVKETPSCMTIVASRAQSSE